MTTNALGGGANDNATYGNDGRRANTTMMGLMLGFAHARANKAFQGSGKVVDISAPANANAKDNIGYGNKAMHNNKKSTATMQRTTMCHKRRPARADTGATRAMTAVQQRQHNKSNGASAIRAKIPVQCWR